MHPPLSQPSVDFGIHLRGAPLLVSQPSVELDRRPLQIIWKRINDERVSPLVLVRVRSFTRYHGLVSLQTSGAKRSSHPWRPGSTRRAPKRNVALPTLQVSMGGKSLTGLTFTVSLPLMNRPIPRREKNGASTCYGVCSGKVLPVFSWEYLSLDRVVFLGYVVASFPLGEKIQLPSPVERTGNHSQDTGGNC